MKSSESLIEKIKLLPITLLTDTERFMLEVVNDGQRDHSSIVVEERIEAARNKIIDGALTPKQALSLEVDNGSRIVANLKVHDYFDIAKTSISDIKMLMCELYCGVVDVLETDDGVAGLKYIVEDGQRKLCAVAL